MKLDEQRQIVSCYEIWRCYEARGWERDQKCKAGQPNAAPAGNSSLFMTLTNQMASGMLNVE